MDHRSEVDNVEPSSVILSKDYTTKGVTVITLNRPHRRNAIDGPTARKLYDAFIAFEDDESQKVCVLHGAGGTFCAGADLNEVSRRLKGDHGSNPMEPVGSRNCGPCGPTRLQVKKPVICAVSQYAVAGGLELSLIADMRVVEEDAVFGVYCRRFGVPLIDGGTVRLQRIVGFGRAMDMILTGRPVPAAEALAMGLANRVVPKGEALREAIRIATELVAFPQLCMNTDRNSCYYAAYGATSFEDAMRNEFNHGAQVIGRESISGAARFVSGEGRHGDFEQRSPKPEL